MLDRTVNLDNALLALPSTGQLAPLSAPRQSDIAAAWVDDLDARAAAGLIATKTADTYRRNAYRWTAWLEDNRVAMPGPADVMAYLAFVRGRGLKPAAVNAHRDAVAGLYRWAESKGIYPAIARSVRGLAVRQDEPLECLPPAHVAALLDHVDGAGLAALRDRALVHVLFSTAVRLVSICSMDVGDLDDGAAVVAHRGKGDRDKCRRAYLSASALDALRRYLDARASAAGGPLPPHAPLFAAVGNRAGGERLTDRSVRRVVVGLMERAGHVRREGGRITRPRVLSAHSLRRSALTAAYDAAGLDAAQTLAGHADPKTTRRAYVRIQKGRVLRDLSAVLDLGNVAGREEPA